MAFDFNGGSRSQKPSASGHSNYSAHSSSAPHPSGSPVLKPSGFQNRPKLKKDAGALRPSRPAASSSNGRRPNGNIHKRPMQRRMSVPMERFQIPWSIVFPIIGIILAVVLCWVFRDEITAFLTQVLAWFITILIIISIIKYIFPGRRR